jgi:hypothetical protein
MYWAIASLQGEVKSRTCADVERDKDTGGSRRARQMQNRRSGPDARIAARCLAAARGSAGLTA